MRRLTLLFGCWILGASFLSADTSITVPLEDDANAKIKVGSFLEELPSRGYAPLEVTIENQSGAPRQWSFSFVSPGQGAYSMMSISSETEITVDNNVTRTIPVLVPLSPALSSRPWLNGLGLDVKGYKAGIDAMNQTIGGAAGSRESPYIAISSSLGASVWSGLKQALKDDSRELNGSLFDPVGLPEDWRGLSGLDGIWLSSGEFERLTSAQRGALRTWTQIGGMLTICGAASVPDDFQSVYYGKVLTGPDSLSIEALRLALKDSVLTRNTFSEVPDTTKDYTSLQPNIPVLLVIVVIFAIVVGPVNIFFFAGVGHRHRMFWTTPLISVVASLLIVFFIFFQEGVGGHGARSSLIYVMPGEHRQILFQQQTSRTGPLFGSSFRVSDPVVILQADDEAQKRRLINNGTDFAGDWFISRAIQTQHIISIVPGRGGITLVDDSPNAPVVVSSFSGELDNLVYMDSQNRRWVGRNVRPGQRTTLESGQFPPNLPRALASGVPGMAGSFIASARDSSAFLNTLASIRWNDKPVIYFGPVSRP